MAIARRFIVVLAAALFLPTWGKSQETKEPAAPTTRPTTQSAVSQEQFEALAKQLGSKDWKDRDGAEKRIVKMGSDAVAHVESLAKTSPDPEVQQRARAILRQIAMASLTQPTLVTLKFNNAPAVEVYTDLFKQAGAQIELWPPNLFAGGVRPVPAVTIDVNKVPFWEAVNKLEQQSGLFPNSFGDQLRLSDRRMGGGINNGRKREVCVTGPFMVTTDDTFPMMTQIDVFVEPRVRVIGHAAEPKIDEVTDENGNPVAPDGFGGRMPQAMVAARAARARMEQFGGNAFSMHLMRPIPRGGSVRGSVRVSVMTEDQTVDIDDVAKANNVERNIDGRRFLLNAMNVDPGEWFITLVAYNADAPTPGMMNLKLDLLDAKGNALTTNGRGMSGSDKRVIFNMTYRQGPNVGAPAKLRMVLPKKSREIDVPFEFGAKPANANAGGGGKAAGAAAAIEADGNGNDDKAAAQ